jgi:hypothetical protein
MGGSVPPAEPTFRLNGKDFTARELIERAGNPERSFPLRLCYWTAILEWKPWIGGEDAEKWGAVNAAIRAELLAAGPTRGADRVLYSIDGDGKVARSL